MGFPSMRDGVSPSSIVLLTQPAPNPPHTPRLRSHTDTDPDVRPHHPSGDHGAPGVAHAHANPDRDRDAHAHADRDRDAHAHARSLQRLGASVALQGAWSGSWVGRQRQGPACMRGGATSPAPTQYPLILTPTLPTRPLPPQGRRHQRELEYIWCGRQVSEPPQSSETPTITPQAIPALTHSLKTPSKQSRLTRSTARCCQ